MELFLGLKRSRRAKANRNTHLNESFARTVSLPALCAFTRLLVVSCEGGRRFW